MDQMSELPQSIQAEGVQLPLKAPDKFEQNDRLEDGIERPPLRHIDKGVRAGISKRYIVAFMAMMGFVITFGMRCTFGVIKMQIRVISDWSVATESMIDSVFFWGYLITLMPGGFLASRFPANRIFGAAIFSSVALNCIVAIAINVGSAYLLASIRLVQGMAEGLMFPACYGIWVFWAPPGERTRLATIALCGSFVGILFGLPISGSLAHNINWQAPFYFYSIIGFIWYFGWRRMVYEKPRDDPTIKVEEVVYIEESLKENDAHEIPLRLTKPFNEMFKSMPAYAIIVAKFCRSWNFYLLGLYQSQFLATRFYFKIAEAGFFAGFPYFISTLIVPGSGILADWLSNSGKMTITNVRKLCTCGSLGIEALLFCVVAYSTTTTVALSALTFVFIFGNVVISGYEVNHLDIAPKYASILMGISTSIGTLAGIICPIVMDYMTINSQSDQWSFVFILAALIDLFGIIFYGIFASGELQSWAGSSTRV